MVEEDIEEAADHWQDDGFVEELQRSENAYLNGAKTYTLDDTIDRAKKAIKKL